MREPVSSHRPSVASLGPIWAIDPDKETAHNENPRRIADRVTQLTALPCLIEHHSVATAERLTELGPSAILIGGQGTPWWEYSSQELEPIMQVVREATCAILGICGGHQLIAMAFGGRVAPMRVEMEGKGPGYSGCFEEKGWGLVRTVRDDPLFAGVNAVSELWLNHCEEVKGVPEGFIRLAEGGICRVMAMRHALRPLYGVQFHPEANWEEHPAGRAIMASFLRIAGLHAGAHPGEPGG